MSITEVVLVIMDKTDTTKCNKNAEDKEVKDGMGGARHHVDGEHRSKIPDDGNSELWGRWSASHLEKLMEPGKN